MAVNWFVGDLARLPIQEQAVDVVLDIFSPANYQEFQRVLKKEGLVIKVVPKDSHLQEIREKAVEQLGRKTYSNQQVIQHFQEHFDILSQQEVEHCQPLQPQERAALIQMTPLLFHVHQELIDWEDLKQVTISAIILVGKRKQNK
ncbi:Ribosomal RNA large subunit methyltransferase A [Streptococcus sp. DD11]|nr:Ribosomal RNA large subunit methyltransferase A [Streptococcus sp. DD11]